MASIEGYHTCSTDGGRSYVSSEAPFLSEPNARQWLTQGYYFWTDSVRFAHIWGKNYPDGYAIIKCKIVIEDHLFLDLVGSSKDIDFFRAKMDKYRSKLEKLGKSPDECTVSTCLAWMRRIAEVSNASFPFIAVKAQDIRVGNYASFLPGHKEVMPLMSRQQLCLFESGKSCIVEKELVHPHDYVS